MTMAESTYYVFYWVSINGDHTDGGCPLMVLLVNVLIQHWVVNKPKESKQKKAGFELCKKRVTEHNFCRGLNIKISEQLAIRV